MAHSYAYGCGCSACCSSERAAERDDEQRIKYTEMLVSCASFVGECCTNEGECKEIARAIGAGDAEAVGKAYMATVMREAEAAVENRALTTGQSLGDAAYSLWRLHRDEEVGS